MVVTSSSDKRLKMWKKIGKIHEWKENRLYYIKNTCEWCEQIMMKCANMQFNKITVCGVYAYMYGDIALRENSVPLIYI